MEPLPEGLERKAREVAERVQKQWNEYHTPTAKEVRLVAAAILAERERVKEALSVFAKATSERGGPSLAMQQHAPTWEAWKALCDLFGNAEITTFREG